MYNIGVIGYGFLGTAIVHGFGLHANIKIYDKFKPGFDTLEDVVDHSDIMFLGLPTPMFEDGTQDISIVEGAVKDIHSLVSWKDEKIVVIKSTVLPGTNKMLSKKYPNLKFVSNPEFLTARSNRLDFICASRNILGGETKYVDRVDALYKHRFGNSLPTFKTSAEKAELVKYAANCFFMTKVMYFNMVYQLCEKMGIEYEEIKDMVLADGRIGRSHCDVPGHDGKLAAGGGCFPKDINAFKDFMKSMGVDGSLLDTVWDMNLKYRPERDWEKIPGVLSKKNGT